MAWTRKTEPSTKHTCGGPAFGRLAPLGTCPRCDELHRGEPSRPAWDALKKQTEADFRRRLRAHNCATHGCGPVCVAFDW